MYGCCGLDGNGMGMAWSYLGQDGLGQDGTDIMGPTLEEIAGGPVDTVTTQDVVTYASGGQVDPSILNQVANIVKAAGPSIQEILQQVQLGQISSSTPVANNPLLRAAIVGSPTLGTSLSTSIASLTSSPLLLIGGAALLLLLMRRK